MAFTQADDLKQLASCDPKLVAIIKEIAEKFDIFVVYGYRSVELQQALYAQGRTKPGKIVTYLDGVNKKSKHNMLPSRAVDIGFPELVASGRWIDTNLTNKKYGEIASYAADVARELGVKSFQWGGAWKQRDLAHFEV